MIRFRGNVDEMLEARRFVLYNVDSCVSWVIKQRDSPVHSLYAKQTRMPLSIHIKLQRQAFLMQTTRPSSSILA
jgi:hypothetical protein